MKAEFTRLIEIYNYINNISDLSTVQKIKEFLCDERGIDVTERTIQRDISKLCEMCAIEDQNDPIDDNDDHLTSPYREVLSTAEYSSLFTQVSLTPYEAIAINMVEDYLIPLLPDIDKVKIFEHAREVCKQVDGSQGWTSKIAILGDSLSSELGQRIKNDKNFEQVFSKMKKAIYTQSSLKLSVNLQHGNKDFEQLNPLGLILKDGLVYLIAFYGSLEKYDFYVFNVLNIHKAEVSTSFSELKDFDLQEFIDEGNIDFYLEGQAQPPNEKIDITLLFNSTVKDNFGEDSLKIWKNQSFKQVGDKYELTATVYDTEQLFCWIVNFGYLVEVVSPDSLREKVRENIIELCKKYGVS